MAEASPTPSAARERRLLLVDDDESNRVTLAALLEDAGWRVVEAASLARAEEALARGGPYEAAVLDVHLGDGLGPALIPALRSASPGAVVVVLSGAGGAEGAGDLQLLKGGDPLALVERIGDEVAHRRRP